MLLYSENRVILVSAVWSQYWRQNSELTIKVIQGQRLLLHIWLPISDCHLSSISHRFRDIALRSRKPLHPSLCLLIKGNPWISSSNLTGKKIRHCATFWWKLHDSNFSSFVTIHSRYSQTDRRQQTYYDNSRTLQWNCKLQRSAKNGRYKQLKNNNDKLHRICRCLPYIRFNALMHLLPTHSEFI